MENKEPEKVKPAVDPALLERLAKAREVAAAKRKAIAEQKKLAKEHLAASKGSEAKTTENNEPAPSEPAPSENDEPMPARHCREQPSYDKHYREKHKKPKKKVEYDSDSSTDSSDTSDSEAEETYKRGKRSKRIVTKEDYALELAKAKAKYQNRYKNRYELMSRLTRETDKQTEPLEHVPVPTAQVSTGTEIRKAATRAAKDDVRNALHKELIASTMKNLFGSI